MLKIFRQRNFAFLWAGQLVSELGDLVFYIALPFYLYNMTGSAAATGLMFIAETLPRLLLSPVAGVLVDRWDRRKTMIVTDLSRALILIFLLFVRSVEWLWLLYLVAFLHNTFSTFYGPAKCAILPMLVKKEDLFAANSLAQFSGSLSSIAGPALGGALLGLAGIGSVIFFDILSFVFSALMLFFIRVPLKCPEDLPDKIPEETPRNAIEKKTALSEKSFSFARMWAELKDGLIEAWKNQLIRGLLIFMWLTCICQGIAAIFYLIFIKDVAHCSPIQFGWICTMDGVGCLLGSLFIYRLEKRIGKMLMIIAGNFFVVLLLLMQIKFPFFIMLLITNALFGIALVGVNVSYNTILQTEIHQSRLGRLFAIRSFFTSLMSLAGMYFAVSFGDGLGPVTMMYIITGLTFVAGVTALVLLRDFLGQNRETDGVFLVQ